MPPLRLLPQLRVSRRVGREWLDEIRRGWEILELRAFDGYGDYMRSLSRKQRWKLRRAVREVEAAHVGPTGVRLDLRGRLEALPMLWSHVWRLNDSIPFGLCALVVEWGCVLVLPDTVGWFERDHGRLVAVVSYYSRGEEVNMLVFAQRQGYERAWLWWHCIAAVIEASFELDGKAVLKLGLNERTLKRRSWNTRAQRLAPT